jgi:catechol 2,3-dioxygenase-like lactoylglutathione lyase family enzyme
LAASFRLADAQELVARRAGAEGWLALKSGASAMIDETSPVGQRPILSSSAAQLFVADVAIASEFYVGKLGFHVDFVYGDPPFYAQVGRDQVRLALRLVPEPVFVDGIREREHLLSAAITVDTAVELKQFFLDCQAAGIRFHQTLKKEPWGARTFIVCDPDDNLILFAGPDE